MLINKKDRGPRLINHSNCQARTLRKSIISLTSNLSSQEKLLVRRIASPVTQIMLLLPSLIIMKLQETITITIKVVRLREVALQDRVVAILAVVMLSLDNFIIQT